MAEKKKFFDVELPLIKGKIKLLALDIGQLNGRIVKIDMTRSLRGKGLEIIFKVKVKGEKAIGEVIKAYLMQFYIRRMMRKAVSYIEDSFSVESENSILQIKPFLITRNKVIRRVRRALREAAKKYIEEYVQEKNTEEIFSDILSNKFQKTLSLKLKKIYPLALCEIRQIILQKKKEKIKEEKVK